MANSKMAYSMLGSSHITPAAHNRHTRRGTIERNSDSYECIQSFRRSCVPDVDTIRCYPGLVMLGCSKFIPMVKTYLESDHMKVLVIVALSNDILQIVVKDDTLMMLQPPAMDMWKQLTASEKAGYRHGSPCTLASSSYRTLQRTVIKYIKVLRDLLSVSTVEQVVHSSVWERRYLKYDVDHLDLLVANLNSVLRQQLEDATTFGSVKNKNGKSITLRMTSVSDTYYMQPSAQCLFGRNEVRGWEREEAKGLRQCEISDKIYLVHRKPEYVRGMLKRLVSSIPNRTA